MPFPDSLYGLSVSSVYTNLLGVQRSVSVSSETEHFGTERFGILQTVRSEHFGILCVHSSVSEGSLVTEMLFPESP